MSFGQAKFHDVTCDLARVKCQNQGLEFVSCVPAEGATDPMAQVVAACRQPGTGEQLGKRLVSGAIGAVIGAGLGYAFDKDPLRGAALLGAIGLLFGDYA